jgi:hypothetical protein
MEKIAAGKGISMSTLADAILAEHFKENKDDLEQWAKENKKTLTL